METNAKAQVQEEAPTLEQRRELLKDLHKAREDWVLAQDHLNYILDPDLVDHAIYLLDAAEKKYCYLLREARKIGLKATPLPNGNSILSEVL